MVKVSFTSKRGKAEKEKMKEKLLAENLEQITADGFDVKTFDFQTFHASDPNWIKCFEKKQFQENLTNLIKSVIANHASAQTEEDELFGSGGAPTASGLAGSMAGLSVEEDEEDDPRRVSLFKIHESFSDPTTNDEYFQLLVQIPQGVWRVFIDMETLEIVVQVHADDALWNFKAFQFYMSSQLHNFHGGLRLAAFSKCARTIISDDAANMDNIMLEDRIPIPFTPEANFYTGAGSFGIFDTVTVNGNQVVMVQCIKQRTNQQEVNENVRRGYAGTKQQYTAPPPQQQQQYAMPQPPQYTAPPNFAQQQYTAPPQQKYAAPPQNQPPQQPPQNHQYGVPPQNQHYQQQQQQYSAPSPMLQSPAPAPAPGRKQGTGRFSNYKAPNQHQNYSAPPQNQHQQQQQQQFHKPAPTMNTNMQGDWRQATGVAYAPGVDPNNLSFTPPPPPQHNVPPVNVFPNTPQDKYNQYVVETVHEEDEEEEEVEVDAMGKPAADDGAQSDTNQQSGTWTGSVAEVAEAISNVIRRSNRSKRTPPSATSSTQEPYTKVQCASNSPESL